MQGQETFRAAVRCLAEVTREALEAVDLEVQDIDLFVYHQANSRIIRAVGQRLGLPAERVVDYVDRFANSSTATLPIALSVAEAEGRLTRGSRVLLASFGGGFTWGATVSSGPSLGVRPVYLPRCAAASRLNAAAAGLAAKLLRSRP